MTHKIIEYDKAIFLKSRSIGIKCAFCIKNQIHVLIWIKSNKIVSIENIAFFQASGK